MTKSMIGRARWRALVPIAVLLTATGCVVQGNPIPDYGDPAELPVGAYSVEPLAAPAGDVEHGRVLESARMADAIVDPVEVDPGLQFAANTYGVTPLPTPGKVRMLLAEPVRAVLEREGMVAGCASNGADRDFGSKRPGVGAAQVLTVIALRFPDAAAAARAARDIDAVDAAVSTENAALSITEYPGAYAHWRPGVPSMAATVADGVFVVTLLIGHTAADTVAMTTLARKTFDAQLPRLREFEPTPVDRLSALPLDPEGMIGRMVPPAPGRWLYPAVVSSTGARTAGWDARIMSVGLVFGRRGAQLWGNRSTVFDEVELIAVNVLNTLYRYPSAVVARRAFLFASQRDAAGTGARIVDAPNDIPDIHCVEDQSRTGDTPRFTCRVQHGRYYAIVVSREEPAVLEKAAAQYGLLINSV
ncbi:hypothetical protein JK358_05740 [Nocardia sp. 2]|uniref:Uncharacterized protein n=1 Tax=Nocardia acididurans TaxID=2802282 RepID=A0ABS1M1E3_9NOCA|nr:hypothetical protein [Nocardia acididurans]MBL1073890.1 hypothetical protein [Nocardia acididurans]